MDELEFQWDASKGEANAIKHQVSFEEAATVFSDANARVIGDPDHSVDEDRYVIIGISSKLRILVVSHCFRGKEGVIRIISARGATPKEVDYYGSRRRR